MLQSVLNSRPLPNKMQSVYVRRNCEKKLGRKSVTCLTQCLTRIIPISPAPEHYLYHYAHIRAGLSQQPAVPTQIFPRTYTHPSPLQK